MSRTTSVTLSPHFEGFVQRLLASGRYETISEVIRESLRLLEDRDAQLSALRRELDSGVEQLDKGEHVDWHSLKADLDAK